jgi:2-amino-4-hydroxy-6-hydroxymethyldihydropteridine diphosphokinase
MVRSFIALGGNVGPVARTFEQALDALADLQGVDVERVSSTYGTRAMGSAAGGDFLNCAAELAAEPAPRELLQRLQEIENRFGRERRLRWGPRTLDLDLILYGDLIIDEPDLQVPHPACWYRRFVLDPLAELAADVVHPVKQLTIGTLRARLLTRPLPVSLAGGSASQRASLRSGLSAGFPEIAVDDWRWNATAGQSFPALLLWLGTDTELGGDVATFDRLPELPRLDATALAGDLETAVRHVLQAAVG